MPRYRADDLVTINLPTDGEWVRVKSKISVGDEVALQQAVVRHARMEGLSTIAEFDPEQMLEYREFALLDIVIKEWSWSDPVTPEGIRELDPESHEFLKEKLNEIYPAARGDGENRDLKASSSTSMSEAKDASPLSLVATS